MKTAVLTFAYSAQNIEQYAEECLISLAAQEDQAFDLIVFNDGMEHLPELISKLNINAKIFSITGSPAHNRCHGIAAVVQAGYEIIIFADIDDYFDKNRVSVSKEIIKKGVDVVVNDLRVFGGEIIKPYYMFDGRLAEGETIKAVDISNGNCMGMSNTAIKTSTIPRYALDNESVIAFDWYFYANVLRENINVKFTSKTITHYRQHHNNTALFTDLSNDSILRGLKIKFEHVLAIKNFDYADEFAKTLCDLSNDSELLGVYCDRVRNSTPSHSFWWEPFKTLKEFRL